MGRCETCGGYYGDEWGARYMRHHDACECVQLECCDRRTYDDAPELIKMGPGWFECVSCQNKGGQ